MKWPLQEVSFFCGAAPVMVSISAACVCDDGVSDDAKIFAGSKRTLKPLVIQRTLNLKPSFNVPKYVFNTLSPNLDDHYS